MPHNQLLLAPQDCRVHFPEAEARLPWLVGLLDAYAALDAGIGRAIAASNRRPACRTGCFACCRQPIPASTLEILGLRWFALEGLKPAARRSLARSLGQIGTDCPFLGSGVCAVYPLRPMACREFVMLGGACRPGEQPERTRPGDLLPLPVKAQREAFSLLLPFLRPKRCRGARGSAPGSAGAAGYGDAPGRGLVGAGCGLGAIR